MFSLNSTFKPSVARGRRDNSQYHVTKPSRKGQPHQQHEHRLDTHADLWDSCPAEALMFFVSELAALSPAPTSSARSGGAAFSAGGWAPSGMRCQNTIGKRQTTGEREGEMQAAPSSSSSSRAYIYITCGLVDLVVFLGFRFTFCFARLFWRRRGGGGSFLHQ